MNTSTTITMTHTSGKNSPLSDIEVHEIANETAADIAHWVLSTANARGVAVRHRPSDRFARAASVLSDAETDLDPVEELLMALRRARVITPFQRGLLQVHYLRSHMQPSR